MNDRPEAVDWERAADFGRVQGGPFAYTPPGPIGDQWIRDIAPVHFIMGPWGSGKTTCGPIKAARITLLYPPCNDGVIRARGVIIRDNFRELYRTTLESWLQAYPKDLPLSVFEGGQDRPFKHTIRGRTPRGLLFEMVVDGFGLGDHAIEGAMKGYQPSWAWLNEPDLLARKVPSFVFGRLNRYPPRAWLRDPKASMPRTVFGDLNPPLISHWVHEDFIEKPRDGYTLLRQPSGLSDLAENQIGHPRENYEAMARTMGPDEVRRFVHGEFGLIGDGALVYPEFDFATHVAAQPLEPLDLPLRIGADAGGSPAIIIGQHTPKGHMRWLAELVTEPGTGIGRFCEYAIDLLQSRFRGLRIETGWGDPSAFHGADRMAGELSFMETLAKALGVNVLPTPTNEPQARQEAVAWFLRRGRDKDGTPFFQMCPSMKKTLGGFQGGFVIALNPHDTAGRVRFVKNSFSHPHEAGQYLCYGSRGHAGLVNDAARAGRPGQIAAPRGGARPRTDFDVFRV